MLKQHIQHRFTGTLTFKVLLGLIVLVLLGLAYNFIVAEDDAPLADDAQEEELQHDADRDTIDIVGDYLWPKMKTSKQDMMTDEAKSGDGGKGKDARPAEEKAAGAKTGDGHSEAPVPVPAPDVTSPAEQPARQSAPAIEKMEAPKIEKIE